MDDDFDKLRALLQEQNYPSVYLFKFIVKASDDQVTDVKRCFQETAEFSTRPSKNGKYISISIKQMMLSTDEIIERYKAVHKIEGVIAL